MIIKQEIGIEDFEAWSGAEKTLSRIVNEGAAETFEQVIEEVYPDGLTETELNDILRFEPEWCFMVCGIKYEEE